MGKRLRSTNISLCICLRLVSKQDELNRDFVALLFLLLFISSWITEVIGIHAFFGAFVFGKILDTNAPKNLITP